MPRTGGDCAAFLQSDESGPLRCVQPLQAGGHQNPILTGERNDIGNRAQRHQIEQRPQIEFRGAGQIDFASAFDQRVGQFERQANGT